MTYLPEDINPRWLNVVRRLQSAGEPYKNSFTIVTIHVLVGPDGDPKLWAKPSCRVIEPRRAVDSVLSTFAINFEDENSQPDDNLDDN